MRASPERSTVKQQLFNLIIHFVWATEVLQLGFGVICKIVKHVPYFTRLQQTSQVIWQEIQTPVPVTDWI
jgi:hypothetical protein